jgi:hypothetical protein
LPDSISLQATDDAAAVVAKAPRITKAFIEGEIRGVAYLNGETFIQNSSRRLDHPPPTKYSHHTICVVTVSNGFSVIGHSAPMSPANYDRELGQQLAYEDAFRKLWPLFAFADLTEQRF